MDESASDQNWPISVWPLLLSIGILFAVPISFILYFTYDKPLFAVLSAGLGVPLMIGSITGWVKEDLAEGELGFATTAMPTFIVSEGFMFIAFFAAYWVTRLSTVSWPPAGTPEHMPAAIPLIMTLVLVASSVTVHKAESRLEGGSHNGFVKWLAATMLLGILFISLSVYEWNHLIGAGFNFKTNIYSSSFYSITGFHLSHVVVGLAIFTAVMIPALAGRANLTMVRAASIYWHFVDVVWLFVVTQVYFG